MWNLWVWKVAGVESEMSQSSRGFKYVLPVCPLKCVLTGAAYYEGLVPILNAYTWCGVDSYLWPEDHSCGSWEFMECNVQGRLFRAACKPGDFSAFNPRFSKHKKIVRYLKTLLKIPPHSRPTENPICWCILSLAIWTIANNLWRIWSIVVSFCFAWYLNFRKVFIPSFCVVWSLRKDEVLLPSHKKFKTTLINWEISLLPFALKSSFVKVLY